LGFLLIEGGVLISRMFVDAILNNYGVLEVMSEERESGVVKWFNGAKGYGFISRESGEDLFVHFSEIQAEGYRVLNEGEKVEFTVAESDKGLQAKEVIKL
jgi:cold shock protein